MLAQFYGEDGEALVAGVVTESSMALGDTFCSTLSDSGCLEVDLARHAGDGAASDPDRAVVVRVTCTRPAARGPCPGRDVRRPQPTGIEQPLRERGVEAPRDRVLDRDAVLREERATSIASGDPDGYGPTTPRSKSIGAGCSASTASALSSMTATQPGPLSTHSAARMSSRLMRRTDAMRSTNAWSTGPERTSGVWRTPSGRQKCGS